VSEDEKLVTLISSLLALCVWFRFYWRLLGAHGPLVMVLLAAPLVCSAIVLVLLRNWASSDVRDDLKYQLMYMLIGAAWVGSWSIGLPVLGINIRADICGRKNGCVAIWFVGALAGMTSCFAGANIGDGPGWWVVLICALLSTSALFVAWAVVQVAGGAVEAITIDRDFATAIRMGTLLTVMGVLFGRASAGNWVSLSATLQDFTRLSWPALPLIVFAAMLGRWLRPTPQHPQRSISAAGFAPAILYVGYGIVSLYLVGAPT
jgi:hypothetical protein